VLTSELVASAGVDVDLSGGGGANVVEVSSDDVSSAKAVVPDCSPAEVVCGTDVWGSPANEVVPSSLCEVLTSELVASAGVDVDLSCDVLTFAAVFEAAGEVVPVTEGVRVVEASGVEDVEIS